MTAARLKLGAQALAVGLVVLLLGLLVWKLVQGSGKEAKIGKSRRAELHAQPRRRAGQAPARLAAREGRGAQLLGLVVRPVQRGGADARRPPRSTSESASWCSASTSTTSTSDARKFARKFRLTYPLVHDDHKITSPKYGLTGVPETFFIDRTGKLVGHVAAAINATDLRRRRRAGAEVVRLAVLALLAAGARRAGGRERAAPDAARARRAADVPDLRGRDARPVGLAGCAADQGRSSSSGSPRATRAARSSAGSSRSWGERILAAPPRHGFDLLAWLLPLVGVLAGAAVLGVLAWGWTRAREPEPAPERWSLNGHPADGAGSTRSARAAARGAAALRFDGMRSSSIGA